jgi:hypothetical protein
MSTGKLRTYACACGRRFKLVTSYVNHSAVCDRKKRKRT